MRECKICYCETGENIRKHEKSSTHKKFLEKAIITKYVEKDINVDRLKEILKTRTEEHMEKLTIFTIIFCWKVIIVEYSITIVKEEVFDSENKNH